MDLSSPDQQSKTLYELLATELRELIEKNTFRPGDRLPSVRQMSQQRRISISTVLQAYALLESQGLIEARPQSGYYVLGKAAPALPEPEMVSHSPDPSQVSLNELVMMVVRDSANPQLVHLGTALPNPAFLPTEKLSRLTTAVVREAGEQANSYIFPPGLKELRVQIASRMARQGCKVGPDEVVITAGCSEAVDLCLQAVCQPGDIVAIESPLYFGFLQSLEAHNLRALEIPTHPRDGLSLDALRFALENTPIKLVLAIPSFNNPLSSCLPFEKREELVRLLERHQIPLLECDLSGELYFGDQHPLPCKAFDQSGLVLYCASFSNDVCPGYRVGWAVAGRFQPRLEWLKFTSSVAVAALPQMVMARFLEGGGYDRHLRRIRREYARNISLMYQTVQRTFPEGTRLTHPTGGFTLWVQLPERVDSLVLYKRALENGITLTPGYVFSPSNRYPNCIRLNAAVWDFHIERALVRLGELVAEIKRAQRGPVFPRTLE